ncbi:unnamed protein product [Effrenium voratum]|uniref:Uncharacterized protein n=1 Tax=Effrenium voratum TaxID=2562239 RepID=A0AA36I6E2_9DINO|nr:unnamed protein product [Effrenium voratum]
MRAGLGVQGGPGPKLRPGLHGGRPGAGDPGGLPGERRARSASGRPSPFWGQAVWV